MTAVRKLSVKRIRRTTGPLSGHLADLPDGRAGQPRRTSMSIEGSLYLSLVEGRLVNEADRRADAIGE